MSVVARARRRMLGYGPSADTKRMSAWAIGPSLSTSSKSLLHARTGPTNPAAFVRRRGRSIPGDVLWEMAETGRTGGRQWGGEAPAARKKRDPAEEELRKQRLADMRRRQKEEDERYWARFPNEDLSDRLALESIEYRRDYDFLWADVFGPFDTTSR
ncbi:hypothetical protein ACP70R_021895 [Stipagrostis hirtigluma subsp. patula]